MQFGWVDFSKEERDKALGFLQALQEQGAVDELGIGTIRDQIADALFPGTSTLITRAKYYLLVPCIIREATDGSHGWNVREVLKWIDDQERESAEKMIRRHAGDAGSQGIIGYQALRNKRWVKRAPSELYWNGIRMFGICPDQGASLRDYIKKSLVYSKLHGAGLGKAREEEENTGDDRSAGEVYGFKPLDLRPLNPRRWRSNLDIALSPAEARFLKDKIMSAEGSRGSVFAFVLRENHDLKEYAGFDAFAEAFRDRVGERNRRLLIFGQQFMRFVYAARVRYNVVFQRGRSQEAENAWTEKVLPELVQDMDFDLKGTLAALDFHATAHLVDFIEGLQLAFRSGDFVAADRFLVEQEVRIKGEGRAKLLDRNRDKYPSDKWIGGDWLDYRLGDTARIVDDIRKGLEGLE